MASASNEQLAQLQQHFHGGQTPQPKETAQNKTAQETPQEKAKEKNASGKFNNTAPLSRQDQIEQLEKAGQERSNQNNIILMWIDTLTETQKNVIKCLFGADNGAAQTYQEVAYALDNTTPQAVKDIAKGAVQAASPHPVLSSFIPVFSSLIEDDSIDARRELQLYEHIQDKNSRNSNSTRTNGSALKRAAELSNVVSRDRARQHKKTGNFFKKENKHTPKDPS